MMVRKLFLISLFILAMPLTYAWNAYGHRLVAQIAYDHLTPQAKLILQQYNQSLNKMYRAQNFVYAASWMDTLRYLDHLWLQQAHYIDFPESKDGTHLVSPSSFNALSAIEQARATLKNPKLSSFNKGFALRLLLHVVGDIHQPLHTISFYSAKQPQGDQGGNLFLLGKNSIGKNLHSFWDKGGGFLVRSNYSKTDLKKEAQKLEQRWPCNPTSISVDPRLWAMESHNLAVKKVYSLQAGERPLRDYQEMVQILSQERIALAGCRLAATLNAAIG